ncbi:MAG: hypothetical protein ABIL07_04710, partial [candidate division WOR-3 bacterium]
MTAVALIIITSHICQHPENPNCIPLSHYISKAGDAGLKNLFITFSEKSYSKKFYSSLIENQGGYGKICCSFH